jgi:hypothetical protein
MKVRCLKIINPNTGEDRGLSTPDISVGNIYDVLVLSLNTKKYEESDVRIESNDDGVPILFALSNFEFVDPTIPSNFGFYSYPDKQFIELTPRSWAEYKSGREYWCDFWDDFFDDEYAAIDLYRKEVAFIKGEPYTPLPKKTPSTKELQEIKRRQERDQLISDQGLNKTLKPIALRSTDDWGQKKNL